MLPGQKKDKVIVFHDDGQSCEILTVKDISDEAIETESGLYYFDQVTKRLDIRNGHMLYCVNVDLPARQEALNLAKLRRSTALKRMFEFDVKEKNGVMKYMPYLVIMLLILFK